MKRSRFPESRLPVPGIGLAPYRVALALSALVLPACGWAQASLPAAESSAVTTVRSYVSAYNAHDVERVLRFIHPDFVWFSVAGDSVTVEARGIPSIRALLVEYFRELPSARSEIEGVTVIGSWVSVRERALWTSVSGPRSQAALSVYEVRDGLLRRVWYYPTVR